MDSRLGNYLISDDAHRLDAGAIHAYLSRSYWAENIPLALVRRSIDESWCVGAYVVDVGTQVGLVRIISDCATYAYLCDVYVLEEHRGQGLASAMLEFTQRLPRFQGVRSWNLKTQDAHGLYEKVGFKRVSNPGDYMTIRIPDAYRGDQSPAGL